MQLSMVYKNFRQAREFLTRFPELLESASQSALKSTGFLVQKDLKKFISTAGAGTFKKWHPLRQSMRTSKKGWWIRQSQKSPLFWLARYSRYWLIPEKSEVHISLRDTKDVHTATFSSKLDKQLIKILQKHELGATQKLTERMKDKLAVGLARAGLKFIKAATRTLVIPRRPIIGPVFSRMRKQIVLNYEKKLMLAIRRHEKRFLKTGSFSSSRA